MPVFTLAIDHAGRAQGRSYNCASTQALMAMGLMMINMLDEGNYAARHGLDGTLAGSLVLVLLILLSLGRGVASIATKDVLGKTIAKQRRGTLMGWSGSIAGGVTLAALRRAIDEGHIDAFTANVRSSPRPTTT